MFFSRPHSVARICGRLFVFMEAVARADLGLLQLDGQRSIWQRLIIPDRELARAYYAEWQRLWPTVSLDRICNPPGVYLPVVLRNE